MREFEAILRMLEVAFAYLQIWVGKLWEGYSWKCPVRGGKKREERDCSLRFQKCCGRQVRRHNDEPNRKQTMKVEWETQCWREITTEGESRR